MLRLTISVQPFTLPCSQLFVKIFVGVFFILDYDSMCSEMDFTLCHKTAK